MDYIFQSPLPSGERHDFMSFDTVILNFNPRSPAGSDLYGRDTKETRHDFNPRSPAGSDEGWGLNAPSYIIFQSPLPSGERRELNMIAITIGSISIPAPQRGATQIGLSYTVYYAKISIPAPQRGAT